MKHLFAIIQYEKVESFNAKQINLKFRRNLTYHHLAFDYRCLSPIPTQVYIKAD